MSGWSYEWFPTPRQAVFDHDQQQVAAVSRAPGNLDLFIVGNDNHVWTTYWNDQAGWSSDWFPVPGQAVFDRQPSRSQRSRAPRATSTCSSSATTTTSGRPTGTTRPAGARTGSRSPARPSSTTTSSRSRRSRAPRATSTCSSSATTTTSGRPTGTTRPAGARTGSRSPARPSSTDDQQQVAAVSRAPGNLDLFIVGNDSHVWTTYWNDQAGWSSDWFPVPGQAVFDRDHQQVAAVSPRPGQPRPVHRRQRQPRLDDLLERPSRLELGLVPGPRPGRLRPQLTAGRSRLPSPGQPRPVHRRQRQPRLDDLLERPGRLELGLVPAPRPGRLRPRPAAGRSGLPRPGQPRPVHRRQRQPRLVHLVGALRDDGPPADRQRPRRRQGHDRRGG